MRIFIALLFFLSFSTFALSAEILRLAAWGPPTAPVNEKYADWARETNLIASSKGIDIEIKVVWNALGAGKTALINLDNGVADIAWTLPTMHPGRFDFLGEFESLDAPRYSIEASSSAWLEFEKLGQIAISNIVPLAFVAIGPSYLHIADETLPQIKGKRIRVAGELDARTIRELGAQPVQMAWTDLYQAIRSKQLYGTVSPWNGFTSIDLQSVTTHHSVEAFGYIMGMLAMNKNSWQELPDGYKELLAERTGLTLSTEFGIIVDDEAANIRKLVFGDPRHMEFRMFE